MTTLQYLDCVLVPQKNIMNGTSVRRAGITSLSLPAVCSLDKNHEHIMPYEVEFFSCDNLVARERKAAAAVVESWLFINAKLISRRTVICRVGILVIQKHYPL